MSDAIAILASRNFDPELLDRLGVRARGDAALYRYQDGGRVVRVVARDPRTDALLGTKGNAFLWNQVCLTDPTLAAEPIVVTMNEPDAIAAIQAGYVRTVCVPAGHGQPADGRRTWLEPLQEAATSAPSVILAMRHDDEGAALLHALALKLRRPRCRWLRYQNVHDTAASLAGLVETGDPLLAKAALDGAPWIAVPGVYRMSELPPRPQFPALDPQMGDLGKLFRVRQGDLIFAIGIPSMGKSTFVNALACHMAAAHGWCSTILSPEHEPATDHREALRRWFGQKPADAQTADERAAADLWIERHFSFIVPGDDDEPNLDWLLERAQAAVVRFDARLLIVDPWNELEHAVPKGETMTKYINDAIRKLRRFSGINGCTTVVTVHPTKMPRADDGGYLVPNLYDGADSSSWFNKADLGLIVHRFAHGTLLRIGKSRNHDVLGQPGDLLAQYDRHSGHYTSIQRVEAAETGAPPNAGTTRRRPRPNGGHAQHSFDALETGDVAMSSHA